MSAAAAAAAAVAAAATPSTIARTRESSGRVHSSDLLWDGMQPPLMDRGVKTALRAKWTLAREKRN